MINGAHVILYSRDADADRAYLRDVLGFPHVDAGGGWLIFRLPPAEAALHPTDEAPTADLYLMCDDLEATVAGLIAKGAVVPAERSEARWGVTAWLALPSGMRVGLYEPRHPVAYDAPTEA